MMAAKHVKRWHRPGVRHVDRHDRSGAAAMAGERHRVAVGVDYREKE
jgi:hypothetical protein